MSKAGYFSPAMGVNVLGVEFIPITLAEAGQSLDNMLASQEGTTRIVVTGNPIMVMDARKDREFACILRQADLLVPDGVGILWAARRLGGGLFERVTGVDLVDYLLEKENPPSMFLLGARRGVAEKAAARIARLHPKARVLGTHHGYFEDSDEDEIVHMISHEKPDVVLAGMGSPRQEKFLWRNRQRLGAKIGMGVGGVIDLLAGETQRAPEVVQKTGLEWLYRLVREPRRLKRDLILAQFVLCVLKEQHDRKQLQQEGDVKDDYR